MSGGVDRQGCLMTAFGMAIIILIMYMIVDCYFDNRAEHELRDLQRRMSQLESEKR